MTDSDDLVRFNLRLHFSMELSLHSTTNQFSYHLHVINIYGIRFLVVAVNDLPFLHELCYSCNRFWGSCVTMVAQLHKLDELRL